MAPKVGGGGGKPLAEGGGGGNLSEVGSRGRGLYVWWKRREWSFVDLIFWYEVFKF